MVAIKEYVAMPNLTEEIDMDEAPVITGQDYQNRIAQLWNMADSSFTHIVFYADREHFSNIEYLTGYDPRFEEALLILPRNGKPVIVVGDEGCDYAARIPYEIEIVVYPTFSLPNQPKDSTVRLEDILSRCNIAAHSKLGLAGWKLFDEGDFQSPQQHFDFPNFIMEAIVSLCENIENVNRWMIGENGLRTILDEKELILAEIAGTKASRAVYRVLNGLREGISEWEASALLNIDGDPLNVHPNINFGGNYFYALASPTYHTRLKNGDIAGVGMAYRRSLCHKVAFFTDDLHNIPAGARKHFELYFSGLTAWYEAVRIGATGDQVQKSMEAVVGDLRNFGIGLNAGHLIHTEEWTSSPVYSNSTWKFSSGMLIQCDFTASKKQKGFSVHSEDGLLLADEAMRKKLSEMAPKSYGRMLERQRFMREVLGIQVADELFPLSDMPGVVFPTFRSLSTVLVNSK